MCCLPWPLRLPTTPCSLTEPRLIQLLEWSESESVSLRLKSNERCSFIRGAAKKGVHSTTKHVVGGFGPKIVSKTVENVTEYFWKFQEEYELIAYRGNGSSPSDIISLLQRSRQTTVLTANNKTPRPEVMVRDPIDMNISRFLYFLRNRDQSVDPVFSIDSHTPRRGSDVGHLLKFFCKLNSWCERIGMYFSGDVFPMEKDDVLDLSSIR